MAAFFFLVAVVDAEVDQLRKEIYAEKGFAYTRKTAAVCLCRTHVTGFSE